MNSRFYNITHIFIPIIGVVAILSAISLYNIKNDDYEEEYFIESKDFQGNKEEPKRKKEDALTSFANKNNISVDDVLETKINKKYSVLSYNDEDKFISEIITNKYQEEADIKDLIREDKEEDFFNLIKEQVEIKYPLFIASELVEDSTTFYYEFQESGIVVHFSNYVTKPLYEEKTFINLTCNMLEPYLDYSCLNTSDKNPNIVELDKSKKTVALTFDDGPNKNTSLVLDYLKQNHAHATFFMVGTNISNFSDTVKRMHDEGQELGSHSYSHKSLLHVKNEELDKEINTVSDLVKNLTGDDIKLLRPPYGSINGEVRDKYPYSYILWSIDPEDWKYRDVSIVSSHVLDDVEDGDIILLHDIHYTSAESLNIILPELYVRGYQVVSVSKLAEIKEKQLVPNNIYRSFK